MRLASNRRDQISKSNSKKTIEEHFLTFVVETSTRLSSGSDQSPQTGTPNFVYGCQVSATSEQHLLSIYLENRQTNRQKVSTFTSYLCFFIIFRIFFQTSLFLMKLNNWGQPFLYTAIHYEIFYVVFLRQEPRLLCFYSTLYL